MALDFRQQLKNALKNVEMSWGSKWERGTSYLEALEALEELHDFGVGNMNRNNKLV